jgi:diamine N-acetyltransferase|tara:strand:+ start:25669 stop:26181 length:513 start_codon:yes stop_codon:yes gene_type:complete
MNKKFYLRQVNDLDHSWLVELHNDPLVLKNITNPTPITLQHHLKWWETIDNKKEIRNIFCIDNQRVGFCKFYKIDYINKHCVLGADIHINYRGMGYANKMWNLMLDYCYENLDLHRVGLTTAAYNKIGQHVYRKVGFKVEGHIKESLLRDSIYYDQICMYHLKNWKREVR